MPWPISVMATVAIWQKGVGKEQHNRPWFIFYNYYYMDNIFPVFLVQGCFLSAGIMPDAHSHCTHSIEILSPASVLPFPSLYHVTPT